MVVDNVEIIRFNLKRIRKKLKLTQEQMADTISEKRTTYARYEKDVRPPQEILTAIHKIHKVDLVEFTKPIPNEILQVKKEKGAPKTEEPPSGYGIAYTLELSQKYIGTLEEQVALQKRVIELQKKELDNLKK